MDYSKFNINPDDLLTTIAYNMQESPSTQAYQSVAAQDNPDWAGFVGSIYRQGDIDRAKFNLDLQTLTASNAAKAARDKEDREFARQKELINLKRKYALADRDRAERLQLLAMDDQELMPEATDWQNNVNTKQQDLAKEHNAIANAMNNAQNLEDYIINSKKMKNLKKAHMFDSSVEAPTSDIEKDEYIHGRLSPMKAGLWKLASLFGNEEATKKVQALQDLANKSKNVFNREDRPTNKGWRAVRNNLIGDIDLVNLENFMRSKQVGQTAWNANDKSIALAKMIMANPDFKELFGSNDLKDFQLLTDPTTFGIDKTYIVDKNTNKPYQIYVDNGTLRVIDPYEE
jgi:acyl transferase domain-containing protein